MGLLRWLSSWFLISKDQNKQVHQKDTLDLAIHPNCFKALHDRGCHNQGIQGQNIPLTWHAPPPAQQVGHGNAFIGQSASNIKSIWHDKLQADTWWVHWLSKSKTNGPYHAFTAPPSPNPRYGLTCRPLPTLWQVSSGTELDDETKQGGKPPVKILTAVTRNLAIAARFLCEYSGPFWVKKFG